MAQQILTPALTVFEHMAVDEVLASENLSEPVLRFYHWVEGPAVTFGYSQFYEAVHKQISPEWGPVCRRPTGGGIVLHGQDLTFSVLFQSGLRPADIYARLHGAIEQELAQIHVCSTRQGAVSAAVYVPTKQGVASGCFANPVKDDLLYNGQKILGGAIRRFGNKVLYQGSLQYTQARTSVMFRKAVTRAVADLLHVTFKVLPISQSLLQHAQQVAQAKYNTEAWTEKFL